MPNEGIGRAETIILKNIYEKKGKASTYLLYKKVKISLNDFMKTLFSLQKIGYVTTDGDWVSITPIGVRQLLELRAGIAKRENGIPVWMKRSFQISPADPYIPSCSRLDRSLLVKEKV